ncbi:hypothetical protein H4CHR_01871 [Variovorax sp. PBS-H4]|uniref:hypothetical protein n=1 Tax=Variovorax sp. PBS-H4 TaxID=434008 RepID=UPI00131775EB|nr:hypothetical protein [Variovorax sp. PBS-H4]VTU26820.1 hypothetical protein H4CHR_01871 [Variovorax sp. PBS-H4]
MRFSSTGSPLSPIQIPADRLRALRQGLLKNPSLLQTDLPPAVGNYFDDRHPADLAAVAQWAVDKGEADLLQQLHRDGFQGTVCMTDPAQLHMLYLATKLELSIELMPSEINSGNVDELTSFLQSPNAKVTALRLNLSSTLAEEPLFDLISAVDALTHLAKLEVEVDSQSEGPVAPFIRFALANSWICLTLSAATRSLILIDSPRLQQIADHALNAAADIQSKADVFRAHAQNIESQARWLHSQSEALPDAERLELEEVAAAEQRTAEAAGSEATGLQADAAAMRNAVPALQSFMSMEVCAVTGNRIKGEFVDALARIALRLGEEGLLRAVCVLAPDYVMELRGSTLRIGVMTLLDRCSVPCGLQLSAAPGMIGDLSASLGRWGSLFVRVDLTITQNLDARETETLLLGIAGLTSLEHFSLAIPSDVSVDCSFETEEVDFESCVDSLVLKGGRAANRDEDLLAYLIAGLRPRSFRLGVGTPGEAAALIAPIGEGEAIKRLEILEISCDSDAITGEPSLVHAVSGLLQVPHKLVNVFIRSKAPLLVDEKEMATLMQLARQNPPAGDFRMESSAAARGGWEGYLHVNFRLRAMAETLFSHPFSPLPPDIGTHMVDIGALSADDIPKLRMVSKTMNEAWGRLSTAQFARFIVFDLTRGFHNDSSLRESLSLPGDGGLDGALVKEVLRQLEEQRPVNEDAVEKLRNL